MMAATLMHRVLWNRWLAWLLTAPLLELIALTTVQYRQLESETAANLGTQNFLLLSGQAASDVRILNDYENFYIVGGLYRQGDIRAAYDNTYLTAAQRRFTGTTTLMPWAYPPPSTAVTPLLPLVGLAWSYMLLMAATLMLYLCSLSKFGARSVGAAMLAVYPVLVLTVRLGQNSMLTGALIGLFLFGLLHGHRSSGVPLGLMVIKPHLAVSIGLLAILQRFWSVIAIAAAVAMLACLAAAVSLILPDLLARAKPHEIVMFYVLNWLGTGSGLAQHFNAVLIAGTTEHPHGSPLNWSLQAVGLLSAAVVGAIILNRRLTMGIVSLGARNRAAAWRGQVPS